MNRNLFFNQKIPFSEDNLESILKACLERNQNAQSLLYKQFFGYSKSVCLRYSSNQEEAKEILNEGFLKVFNNLDKYLPELSFKAWLRTIMVNTAINYYRDNKKYNQEISFDGVEEPIYDEDIINKISADEILVLVQKLPPSYRTVFVMHVVDGYNHREIGEILEINEGTSRSNFMKARVKLQNLVQKEFPHLYENYHQEIDKHSTK
ncbi:DNA-directed RNA polymerase sigma-70 factor [Emticicia aquatilis]|uniref:DNA-directed RNA polymerase sigma-70 factor n=1 Tax=Emticicia aquatilis TaxID=1537369 RepID=A0A916YJS6_9BACT|nr:RNA polymerase sigma factor [Emticicia aquatilis]GGD48298.1 DNA-directed RNA polymerase sigma-70 factor [Emticicia aquatilis]